MQKYKPKYLKIQNEMLSPAYCKVSHFFTKFFEYLRKNLWKYFYHTHYNLLTLMLYVDSFYTVNTYRDKNEILLCL